MDPTGIIRAAELLGFVLASYGVLRESFADLAQGRGYGEGRYGEGAYGGSSKGVASIVKLGVLLRLLPSDKRLTVTDRYTRSEKNRTYVLRALAVLHDDPGLIDDEKKLWRLATDGANTQHNSQIDVLAELWRRRWLR